MRQPHEIRLRVALYCMQIQAPNIQEEVPGKRNKNDQRQRLYKLYVRFKDQRTNMTLWIIWGSQNHTEAIVKALKERKKKKQDLKTFRYASRNRLAKFENLTFSPCLYVSP